MKQLRKRIVPMNKRAGYFEAWKLTKDKGGLPPNALLDDYLVETDRWKADFFPLWTREILVYPEIGGEFKKGKDVVDSFTDELDRRWILPASYVPEEAIGRKGVGLFVDPGDITEVGFWVEKGKVVIHPRSVVVLHPFIERSGEDGKADEETRIPLRVEPESLKNLLDKEKRSLYRVSGVGIRPLVRGGAYYWECVAACDRPDNLAIGVAYVEGRNIFQEKKPLVEGRR